MKLKKRAVIVGTDKLWMTSAEALKLVAHDGAQLLALSGLRNL